MKVVIIGSGNTAAVLGAKIVAVGHEMLQVVARKQQRAAGLAAEWSCGYTTRWAEIRRDADLYIVAISDRALDDLGESLTLDGFEGSLSLPGKLVVHTAGAVTVSVLRTVSDRCGVLYPLQSLKAGVRPYPPIPLLIDANLQEDLPAIEAFAKTLSGQVQQADDSTRLKLHVAAVLVNNFTNYLYTLAADYCDKEGLDFTLLLPLILETAERVSRFPPAHMQTGPAIRGDENTQTEHLKLLSNYNNMKELYSLFTIQIEDFYKNIS